MNHKFQKAALGGTFDRLHIGHETLLSTALQLADRVIVGVTHKSLNQHKTYTSIIQDYSTRVRTMTEWLETHKQPHQSIEVVQIQDIYGPTLTDPDIDVLVVTPQTRSGGDLINLKRQEQGLSPLPIVEVPLIKDDAGIYVSSTRIRSGSITRTGMVYQRLLTTDFIFAPDQIKSLRQIQGKLISEDDLKELLQADFTAIALVGDVITQTFLNLNLPFTYAIIDGQTKRHSGSPVTGNIVKINAVNLPGTINSGIAGALLDKVNLSSQRQIFEVGGEEDLLAFIPVLTLPINSVLFYGQPNLGIGMIVIDETTKLHYARFINPDIA